MGRIRAGRGFPPEVMGAERPAPRQGLGALNQVLEGAEVCLLVCRSAQVGRTRFDDRGEPLGALPTSAPVSGAGWPWGVVALAWFRRVARVTDAKRTRGTEPMSRIPSLRRRLLPAFAGAALLLGVFAGTGLAAGYGILAASSRLRGSAPAGVRRPGCLRAWRSSGSSDQMTRRRSSCASRLRGSRRRAD